MGGVGHCEPRISRLMALAIRFEKLIADGTVWDYSDLARLGGVTRARITQIMNLLNLAPATQEQLLFLPPTPAWRDEVHERGIRSLAGIVDFEGQRIALELLKQNRPNPALAPRRFSRQ